MNFDFAERINPDLEKLDFAKALQTAEGALRKLSHTPFHEVLDKPLTSQAGELAEWVEQFYRLAAKKAAIKALYFEMNEFDINTDSWYIDCFGYSKDGGLDLNDMEWLCDFEADSQTETETLFAIEGYEPLQASFAEVGLSSKKLQDARDWCEQIIIARFMELMRETHLTAKEKGYAWASLPIYFTEHSYDFIVRSEIS